MQARYRQISIEGDNLVATRALKGINQVPWQIATIIQDVRIWIHQVLQATINHTFREAVWQLINWLSKFVYSIIDVFISDFTVVNKRTEIV